MYLLYLSLFFFFAYFDMKMWGRFSPLIIIFSGVTVISIFYHVCGRYMGFVELNSDVFLYISCFLGVSFFASVCAFLALSMFRVSSMHSVPRIGGANFANHGDGYFQNRKRLIPDFFFNKRSASWFLVSVAILQLYVFATIVRTYLSLGRYSGEEFENALSYGVIGHSFTLLASSVPILYLYFRLSFTRRLRFACLVLLVFCFSLLFARQVKYWVMVPLVWIIIINLRVYGVSFYNFLSKALGVLLLSFGLFFMVYVVQALGASEGGDLGFAELASGIFYHFLGYAFSGLVVFSFLIEDGFLSTLDYRDIFVAFEGFVNLVRWLFGAGVYSGEHFVIDFYVLDEGYKTRGNVATLWADFMIYLGAFAFPIYFFMNFAFYCLHAFSFYNFHVFVLYSGIMAFMFFSWFSSYFKLVSPYEVPILALAISVVLFFVSRIKVCRIV